MTLYKKNEAIRVKSPCGATRWNSIRIREIILNSALNYPRSPWVQGVLVFTQRI